MCLWQTGITESFLERKGLRPKALANTEGNSVDEGRDFFVVGRGAAHSNTRERRNESRDSFLDYRKSTRGKGDKVETGETEETEDVTWGFLASPQVYYKYNPSEDQSGSPVIPP